MSEYVAAPGRYEDMHYRRCGASGLQLPAVSLGLWHNFGGADSFERARALLRKAFDRGITHFDLANNYGPPPGSAEETMGRVLQGDLRAYRDEIVISSKAGYTMWPGPYGDWGSRKYIVASCDQSLARMGLDYVDIFYHHRPDPATPLEETMAALVHLVNAGKALYVGLSNYPAALARNAVDLLRQMGVRCLIHQPRYNMLDRWIEPELLPTLNELGVGCIAFSPLAQGLLTNRYLEGRVPADSRAARSQFLRPEQVTEDRLSLARRLDQVARERGQTLAQMALAWVLRHESMTSVLIGASRPEQIDDAAQALARLDFSAGELAAIDAALRG